MSMGRVVFVHGAGSSAAFWHLQREAFPDARFINLPGHTGERDRAGAGHPPGSIEEYGAWLGGYIEGEGLQSVVLCGHSMGGAVSLSLALRRPSWLRALVLTASAAKFRVAPRLLELLRTDYPAAVDYIIRRSFAPRSVPLSYAERARVNGTRRQMLRTPQAVTLSDYEACARFNVVSRLHELAVPTLCVVGAQDMMVPAALVEETCSLTGMAGPAVVIEGAGHMLPIEKPEEYNHTLARFLRE